LKFYKVIQSKPYVIPKTENFVDVPSLFLEFKVEVGKENKSKKRYMLFFYHFAVVADTA
jgi:hypothetical protein